MSTHNIGFYEDLTKKNILIIIKYRQICTLSLLLHQSWYLSSLISTFAVHLSGSLGPKLFFFMRTAKTLNRLGGCQDQSLLCAQFSCKCLFIFFLQFFLQFLHFFLRKNWS